jgi:flagellar FliL protein
MGKVIALLLIAMMGAGGAAGGYFLRPPVDESVAADPGPLDLPEIDAVATFRDGFVVPVLRDGRVWSHIIMTLGVSSDQTEEDVIIRREPLLRDGITEALFLHGSLGGFDGDFTDSASMARLRTRLDSVLQVRLDDPSAKILIVSLARQAG